MAPPGVVIPEQNPPMAPLVVDDKGEQHYAYAMQLVTSLALPMVLQTAVKLEVFEIIARAGPGAQLSATQIAAQLPTKNLAAAGLLERNLALLASYSVLTCSVADVNGHIGGERLYGLTPVAKYFVRDEDGASLGPLLNLLHDKVYVECWFHLKDSILQGGVAFDRAHGSPVFEYTSKDERFNETFNEAMVNHSTLLVKRILEVYKGFQDLKTLVDVGGGLGNTMKMITSAHPNIKGINFDLPHVIKNAPFCTGVEHVGGDMFQSIPKADAVFMQWMFPLYGDDHCIKLLNNCYEAIPDHGKVIAVDAIAPVIPNSSSSAKIDLQFDQFMLIKNGPGKQRTEAEFRNFAKAAGFSGLRLQCRVNNFWVMEFFKSA